MKFSFSSPNNTEEAKSAASVLYNLIVSVSKFSAAIGAGVVEERSHFEPPPSSIPLPQKNMKIDTELFTATAETQSLQFHRVVSRQQKADFWSPKPENIGCVSSDIPRNKEFQKVKKMEVFDNTSTGRFVKVT